MVKTYRFDLDLPENKRWITILDDNKELIPLIKKTIDNLINLNNVILSAILSTLILYNKNKIKYYNEIESISEKTNIEFNKVLLMQLIYETHAACTTIATKVNDKNVFFRTMDWPMNVLKKLTINLDVYKNNKLISHVPTWIGCVGFFTTYMNNEYAIAINYKRLNGFSVSSIYGNIKKLLNMYWPASYLVREICEQQYDRKMAIELLEKAKLVSPCYFTVFNENGKSCVITRESENYTTRESEHIIQTNCDYDKIIPNILWSIERRNIIKSSIEKNNNNYATLDLFLKEICKKPIINNETIFINVINDNKLTTFIP
jgi:hypothetical protein